MYTNRALAIGLDGPLADDDLDLIEVRSAAVGVPAAIEITPATDPGVAVQLARRGYVAADETAALRRRLDDIGRLPVA